MSSVQFPLSGDVTQAINPWNWTMRLFGSQLGLVNINLGKSSDPELEAQILDDVGSYGRQLGQMADAMRVLFNHMNQANFTPDERMAVDAFLYQMKEIDRLKAKRREAAKEATPGSRVRRSVTLVP